MIWETRRQRKPSQKAFRVEVTRTLLLSFPNQVNAEFGKSRVKEGHDAEDGNRVPRMQEFQLPYRGESRIRCALCNILTASNIIT